MSELTLARQAQLIASAQNRKYFLENFYQIPIVGVGAAPLKMRPYQEEVVDALDANKNVIGLKARQIGWTTIGVAYALHDALFHEERPWLFVSATEDKAVKMLDKAKYALQRLPGWMKKELPAWNATQTAITFTNGSRIESLPATASTGRTDSVHGALLDEAAFMEYAPEIWAAIEPLAHNKRMIFSTANGMGNFFHDVWLDSQQEDSGWQGVFFPWSVVPERDEDWYNSTKRVYRGREWFFYQEYPSSPEEAFAKSGRVAFQADIVNQCYEEMEPVLRLGWAVNGVMKELSANDYADIEINVWKPPSIERDGNGTLLRRPNYVISGDFAEGMEHGDFTYFTVFNANPNLHGRYEQVASCKSSIPIAYSADLMQWLGYWYHTGLLIGERNNAGVMPLELLGNEMWYPRLYRMNKFAEIPSSEDRTPRYGWFTDKKSKSKMVNDFVLALAEGMLLLHDRDFVIEAQTFVADGKGSFSATSNNHDDVIMGTLIGWQGVLDSPDYPVLWTDNTVQPVTHKMMDEIFFPKKKDSDSILYRPIGQKPFLPVKKGFLITPGNIRKNSSTLTGI